MAEEITDVESGFISQMAANAEFAKSRTSLIKWNRRCFWLDMFRFREGAVAWFASARLFQTRTVLLLVLVADLRTSETGMRIGVLAIKIDAGLLSFQVYAMRATSLTQLLAPVFTFMRGPSFGICSTSILFSFFPPIVLDFAWVESRSPISLTNLFEVVTDDLLTLNQNLQSSES